MNKKQLIVALGLGAYIFGGLVVVIFNMRTFIGILRWQLNLFIPVLTTYILVITTGIIIIYFLRKRKGINKQERTK